jgi:hypothetical protein
MGIFRNITRNLKKAAPLIGSAIGMYIAGPGYAALGGALGGGIGSLVGGGDTEDALKAAALGGIAGYAGSKFMSPSNASNASFTTASSRVPVGQSYGFDQAANFSKVASTPVTDSTGILSKIGTFAKENPFTTAGIAGLGLTALGGGFDDDEKKTTETAMRPYPTGKPRLGVGIVDGVEFNFNDEEERKEDFRRVREKQGIGRMMAANGGEVNGPGTGTSDSVPARLSDGEFVLTAKAVRGAGGGDRDLGAARMYDMMSELERVA